MRRDHGFKQTAIGLDKFDMLRVKNSSGDIVTRPILRSALETIGRSDVEGLENLLEARLELLQVFYGGTSELCKKLDVDELLIKRILDGRTNMRKCVIKKIDDLWDRAYKLLKHGQ